MKNATLQLGSSKNPPLSECLERATRLVSDEVGILSKVEILNLPPGEPPVFHARTIPADISNITGYKTMNFGSAISTNQDVAIMKAVGESIERYCSSHIDENKLVRATQEELNGEGIDLQQLALFSENQYSQPNFKFPRITSNTPLYWVKGFSLSQGDPVWIPASLVFMPYLYRKDEPIFHDQISTGLACGTDIASATYRGIFEIIERDAFMIVWHNKLICPTLDPSNITDPYVQSLLNALDQTPVHYFIKVLTLDIEVTTLLVMASSKTGSPPHNVIGMAVDLDPLKALSRALEEVILVYLGMTRYQRENPKYKRDPEYKQVTTPAKHGIIHAMESELQETVQFLKENKKTLTINDLPNYENGKQMDANQLLAHHLQKNDLEGYVVDLTTVDIDDVGFKVVRTIIPKMQPLDLDHAYPYLGGNRLYEVPFKLGLVSKPLQENEVNPDPHPFP